MGDHSTVDPSPLGQTGIRITPIGFGAVKIGRNQAMKYPRSYELPSDEEVFTLLNGILDLGINYIDTAPAYGLSEYRIGQALGHRSTEYVISTKVGESFVDGQSRFDFSQAAIRTSVERSRKLLHTDVLDIVLIHSDGQDEQILEQSDAVPTLLDLRQRGLIKAIGLSGKSHEGFLKALPWADVVMVEFCRSNQQHKQIIDEAQHAGVGVLVKKGLDSGQLDAKSAIQFVLSNPAVSSLVVGGLNLDHVRQNVMLADQVTLS